MDIPAGSPSPPTFYDAVGGAETFDRLVHHFYTGVRADPVLRPLYPEDELEAAEERLRLFLVQYWGGPRTYSAQRGHPRLRMRHAPFRIGLAERDAWLRLMRAAVDSLALAPEAQQQLWDYFAMAADSMVNSDHDGPYAAGGGDLPGAGPRPSTDSLGLPDFGS